MTNSKLILTSSVLFLNRRLNGLKQQEWFRKNKSSQQQMKFNTIMYMANNKLQKKCVNKLSLN